MCQPHPDLLILRPGSEVLAVPAETRVPDVHITRPARALVDETRDFRTPVLVSNIRAVRLPRVAKYWPSSENSTQ